MKPSSAALAPLALTVALVGYLLSGVAGPPAPEAAPAKAAKVDAALLAPRFGPFPARDPFLSPEPRPAEASVAAAPRPAAGALAAPAPHSPAPPTPPVAAVVASADSAPAATETAPTPVPDPEPAAPRATWRDWATRLEAWAVRSRAFQSEVSGRVRLSATSIRGDARRAILNNRFVAEGEAVPGLDGPGGPVIVDRIQPSSVVLRSQGTFAVVRFPGAGRGPETAAGRTRSTSSTPGRGRP